MCVPITAIKNNLFWRFRNYAGKSNYSSYLTYLLLFITLYRAFGVFFAKSHSLKAPPLLAHSNGFCKVASENFPGRANSDDELSKPVYTKTHSKECEYINQFNKFKRMNKWWLNLFKSINEKWMEYPTQEKLVYVQCTRSQVLYEQFISKHTLFSS